MPSTVKPPSSSREQLLQLYGLYADNLRHESQVYRHHIWVFLATQAVIGFLALKTLGPESWPIGLLDPPQDLQQTVNLFGLSIVSLAGVGHALMAYSYLLKIQSSLDHVCEVWNTKYWTLAHSFGLPDLMDRPCAKPPASPQASSVLTPRLPFGALLAWTCLAAVSLAQVGFELMT